LRDSGRVLSVFVDTSVWFGAANIRRSFATGAIAIARSRFCVERLPPQFTPVYEHGRSSATLASGTEACPENVGSQSWPYGGIPMLMLLINVLIIIVIGAICFYLIDRFVRDRRLGNLLKILVVLICIAEILRRLGFLF
jgi:hypothetical protein